MPVDRIPPNRVKHIVLHINQILSRLTRIKFLLPEHKLPGQLEHFFNKLNEIKRNIKELPALKIKETLELIEKNTASMQEFLKAHKNNKDLRAYNLVKESLAIAEDLKKDLTSELSRRENLVEAQTYAPAGQKETSSLRDSILTGSREVLIDPVTGKIELVESKKAAPVKATESVSSKSAPERRVIEILVRLLNALISRKIIESLKREVRKFAESYVELTAKDFRKIAEKVTAEIMAELDAVLKAPKEQEKFTCKITFDEKESKFRVEVSGKTNESETLKSLKDLLQSAPKENVPRAMEEAVRLIAEKPQDKAAVWKVVAEILKPSAESHPAGKTTESAPPGEKTNIISLPKQKESSSSHPSETVAPPAEIVKMAAAAVQTAQEIIAASPAPEAVIASLAQTLPEENIAMVKAVLRAAYEMVEQSPNPASESIPAPLLQTPKEAVAIIKAVLQEAYALVPPDAEPIAPVGAKAAAHDAHPAEITAAAQTLIKTVEKMLTPPAEPNESTRIITYSSEEVILIPAAAAETPKQVAVSSASTYTILLPNPAPALPARKDVAVAEEIKVTAEPSAKVLPFAPKKGTAPKVAEEITPATQAVLEILVRDIETTFSNLAAEKDPAAAQNHFTAKLEMVQAVLEQLPQAALPVLLREHARAASSNPRVAEKVIAPLIQATVKTEAGKDYVLHVFSRGAERELVATAIGRKVILQTVQHISEKAPMLRGHPAQPIALTEVAPLVAAANKASLAPAEITVEKAQAFLRLVTETQKNLTLIQPAKTTRRSIRPRPAAVADYPSARTPGYRRMNLQPRLSSLQRGKLTEASKSVRALLSAAQESGLALPETIKSALYSGLANLTPFSPQTPPANFSLAGESRAASSLKRVLAVLESQLVRPASLSLPASDLVRTFSLSAQALLYGLIMRLVKGKISEVEDIVEALRKKKQLGRLVKDVEEGLTAEAVEAIDRLILLADRLSRYQGYDEKALSEALEIMIALEKAEVELKIPAPEISLIAA